MSLCFRPRSAQGVCLGLAAALGHGLGKVGEENGEPQPKCDLQPKGELSRVVRGVPFELDRRKYGAYFHHKHYWVFDHRPWIQLAKRIQDSPRKNGAIGERLFSNLSNR